MTCDASEWVSDMAFDDPATLWGYEGSQDAFIAHSSIAMLKF